MPLIVHAYRISVLARSGPPLQGRDPLCRLACVRACQIFKACATDPSKTCTTPDRPEDSLRPCTRGHLDERLKEETRRIN